MLGAGPFGVPLATVIVSTLSLTGHLAATYILPEVHGYVEQEHRSTAAAAAEPAGGWTMFCTHWNH